MKINVYCRNLGWLFEDLKKEIAGFGAVASEEPLQDADAWICIRDTEARLSPDKSRTVVTIHHTEKIDHQGYGLLSFVHPFPERNWRDNNLHDDSVVLPIGSRPIPKSPLPSEPTLGFFCREHGKGLKRSQMFADAVELARKKTAFKVLMIGQKLEHIAGIGKYEKRPAVPEDYARITALCSTSVSPMIPLSVYEAMAAGRPIITTPREFPFDHYNVFQADNVEGLAQCMVEVLKFAPMMHIQKPFCRIEWAKTTFEQARSLCARK